MATDSVNRQSSISAQSSSHSLTHRYAPRFAIAGFKPVRVDLGPAGAGQIVDISTSGMRVRSVAPLRRSAEVPIRVDSLSSPLQCSGIVVWSKATGTAGIRFTNLTDTQQKILSGWLSDLEQATTGGPTMSEQLDEYTRIINQVKNGRLNNADALSVIAQRALEATAAGGAAIALGKPENMVCLASAGDAPEIGTVIPPSAGLTGECLRSKKLVLCHNAQTDPRIGKGSSLGSAVIVPLLVNSEIRGVMEAFSERPHAFDPKAIEVLESLAEAATYVTYGNTPVRRLATVTPMSSSSTGVVSTQAFIAPPKNPLPAVPSQHALTAASSFAASVAAPALEPLPLADIVAAPIAPKPAPAPVTKPVAKEAALPLAAAPSLPVVVRPKPVTTDGIDLRELLEVDETVDEIKPKAVESKGVDLAQASRTQTYFPGQYEFETKPATGRWMVRAIAAGVLLVAPLWYFALRPKPSDTANSATVETPAITTPAQAEVSPNVVPASSPMTVTPNAAPTPAPSKPASTPAVSKTRSNEPADNVVDTVKPAEPAPLVLASGRPMSGRNIEDASAPSVPLAIPAGSVPLPAVGASASAATPSLAPRVTHSWTGGTPIRKVAPIYPSTARDRGLRGEVEVVFTVRKDGSVANVHAISGNPILATAAVEAVKSWRYEPFKADGQPAEVQNSVKLNFVLPR